MKKTFKTLISVILVLFLAISSSALSSNNTILDENISVQPITVNDCYTIAENFIKSYYLAQQTSSRVNFENYFFYSSLNNYLQTTLKSSYFLAENDTVGDIKNSLIADSVFVNCSLLSYNISDNAIELNIQIEMAIKYPKSTSPSYFGNSVDFLFVPTNNTYKIADIIFEDELNTEISLDTDKWNYEKNASYIQQRIQQQEQNHTKFSQNVLKVKEYALSIMEIPTESINKAINSHTTQSSRSLYSFNRSAMASYAKRTAPLKRNTDNKLYYNGNSARGSSQAPYYYDFSAFSGSYDCTNFVSHCLLAGGAKMNKNSNPSTGWYFNNTGASGATTRSYTWSSVTQFGNMLINNSSNGPRGNVGDYYSVGLELGDIIQFAYSDYNAGSYGHTTIITKELYGDFLSNYSSEIGPIMNCGITSRSSNSSYKIDQNFYRKLLNLDGGNTVVGCRCIHLTGYAY